MAQPSTYFLPSLCLDLPYVGVVNHENGQKSDANYLQDNLHPLRLSGLTTS